MTIPTNFYTQQASLLPQGLQSLISSGQLAPTANPMLPPQPMGNPSAPPYAAGIPQIPTNWNQAAQQAAPIYQPPAPVPAPRQIVAPQPAPWSAFRDQARVPFGNALHPSEVA